MVNKIYGWVNKLEHSESNEEIINFKKTLNNLQMILKKLYKIEVGVVKKYIYFNYKLFINLNIHLNKLKFK